jgi:hypothetical protein
MARPKLVQAKKTTLYSPITSAETGEIILKALVDLAGNQLTMTDFGDQGYVTFNPGGGNCEIVKFTGFTVNDDDTVTLDTGIVRGLRGVSPYGSGGTAYEQSAGAVAIISNNPQIYDDILDYIDAIAIAGSPDMSLTTKGIGEEATAAEIDAGTQVGSTGAELVVNPKYLKDSIYYTRLPTADPTTLFAAKAFYPVGSIYMATVSTNPATLLGFGTWIAYGAGRVLVGAGTGSVVATFASRSSNVITVTGLTDIALNEFQTGQAVLYTAASGAMTGLTHNTTYYLIRVSNTTFSLATTLALAQAGTAISLSSDGTGVQTFTLTLTARTAGDTGGEEKHAMSSAELLAHTHPQQSAGSSAVSPGYSSAATTREPYQDGIINGSAGGNVAMNNMQPFITCYMWSRTV